MSDDCRCGLPTCDECSIAAWMHDFAAIDDREHILPNASIVWLKAQLLQQTRTVDRAARPMTIVQTSAYVFVAACWTMLLSWKWDAVVAWANTLTPSRFLLTATGNSTATSLTMTFFMVVALLSSATVMLALHTILAED
jgi:hypothetical protein